MRQEQLEEQLQKHHEASFGWALHCCEHQREMAQEVLQRTYLMVLDGRAKFSGRSSFKTFLFAVMRRIAAGERRKRALLDLRFTGVVGFDSHAANDPSVVDRMQVQDRNRTLALAVAGLPRRQREVLHLVFYQDCTLEQAAQIMRVSVGSVRSYYARAKDALRENLDIGELRHA
ncbi:MAG: RNA polymerase sigma factor [Gammaproteobacteria bacterium]|nr:RNA polymerase sigma factor [Gammaproteobacteria bacterium]